MSEPVRQMTLNDRPGRTQPGPLRDWLATMKATTAAKGTITIRSAPEPVTEPSLAAPGLDDTLVVMPAADAEPRTDAEAEPWPEAADVQALRPETLRPEAFLPEPLPPQVPSVVEAQAPIRIAAHSSARIELTRDLSELMAENLMLKTRLRLENERYEGLQAMLADEMRILRGDAEADMKILDAVCAERDQLKSLTANAARKMHEMSARIESEVAQLAEARSERDLWMARAEALAQPLFQRR